ncbi:hypothetical protein PsorP6_007019 [Peronosclerospora sorghi]|uniref:Uncharacterized protein n=1 Tax=Peronosclerospora sorghi TaxID=230839 RepID=A0ACC0WBC2_9STRA|nr:hypothetical protein PsorP6_007019 [Peronosclerospora sorghi]
MQRRTHGVAFSAYTGETEDYYTVLPSDESLSDVEDEAPSCLSLNPSRDPVEKWVVSPLASASSIPSPSKIMTRIRSLTNNHRASDANESKRQHREGLDAPALGTFNPGTEDATNVSPRALERYHARKTQLQDALDVVTSGRRHPDAPFPIDGAGASPAPEIYRVEGHHAPEKKRFGKRPSFALDTGNEETRGQATRVEPDPLYDEELDDADEHWVQRHLCTSRENKIHCALCFMDLCARANASRWRRAWNKERDRCNALLSMLLRDCVHGMQTYRATTAMNCRVQRDEILTYAGSDKLGRASLPFQKRQQLHAETTHEAVGTTPGQQLARWLQRDEFYPVTCSDCGTLVGVYDRDQHYHFFNTLPSYA